MTVVNYYGYCCDLRHKDALTCLRDDQIAQSSSSCPLVKKPTTQERQFPALNSSKSFDAADYVAQIKIKIYYQLTK